MQKQRKNTVFRIDLKKVSYRKDLVMRHDCDFSNPRGLMRTTLLEIQAHKWQGQVGAFMLLSMFCKAYASSTVRQGRRPNVAFCILLGSARSLGSFSSWKRGSDFQLTQGKRCDFGNLRKKEGFR